MYSCYLDVGGCGINARSLSAKPGQTLSADAKLSIRVPFDEPTLMTVLTSESSPPPQPMSKTSNPVTKLRDEASGTESIAALSSSMDSRILSRMKPTLAGFIRCSIANSPLSFHHSEERLEKNAISLGFIDEDELAAVLKHLNARCLGRARRRAKARDISGESRGAEV